MSCVKCKILLKESEDGIDVTVPALHGIVQHGITKEDALKSIMQTIQEEVDRRSAAGIPIFDDIQKYDIEYTKEEYIVIKIPDDDYKTVLWISPSAMTDHQKSELGNKIIVSHIDITDHNVFEYNHIYESIDNCDIIAVDGNIKMGIAKILHILAGKKPVIYAFNEISYDGNQVKIGDSFCRWMRIDVIDVKMNRYKK